MLFVGDDWAEDHHDVEVMDASGRRLARARLEEGIVGMSRLHALIGQFLAVEEPGTSSEQAPGSGVVTDLEPQVLVGIETDRGPWVQALIAAGYRVYPVNPLQAARYRERHSVSGAKSDPADAHVLADMVRTDAHQLRPAAGDSQLAEAVNTIKFKDGRIVGDNTDGVGLCRDICHNLQQALQGKRILLLGAGGAARGVILPLLAEQPACLTIANRTASKAEQLAQQFQQHGTINASSYQALAGQTFDVVINATSASLSDALPPLPAGCFAPGSLAYDMMYGKGLTPFLRFAQQQGAAHLADGLGMLVEQAAEAFRIWRGVRPDTAPVINSLRASLC